MTTAFIMACQERFNFRLAARAMNDVRYVGDPTRVSVRRAASA